MNDFVSGPVSLTSRLRQPAFDKVLQPKHPFYKIEND